MNRKGFVSFIPIFVLMMVVIVLALAQRGIDTSTINKTIETLNWTNLGENVTKSIQNAADNSPNYIANVVLNILSKAIDFFGYTVFEITKLAMQLARDNPNIINWKILLTLIILSLIAPLIYPLFIVIVSLILIIKEWYLNRKEKKELNKLRKKGKEIR